MIGPTGIWSLDDARTQHCHSGALATALLSACDRHFPVLDFGCGRGFYCAHLARHGFRALGLEGTPGMSETAMHRPILEADLSRPLNLPLPVGTVLCLEVGEHIPVEFEAVFRVNLVRHVATRLILSWAVPGQGGYGHVNCRPNSYVIERFTHDHRLHYNLPLTQFLRQAVARDACSWFRDTLLVFER